MSSRTAHPVWYPEPDAGEVAASVATAFRTASRRAPVGVWAAPGRVNVVGEHVDYNAGLCLPFALPHRTFVALAPRDDGVVRVASAQVEGGYDGRLEDVAPGAVEGWSGYAVGVPWALRRNGLDVGGFDAVVDGRVPFGSGLSSSAAIECAVAVALDDVHDLGLGASDAGRARLAAACVEAETRIAGAPTGGLDQAASLRCEEGSAMLLDCRDFTVSLVPFDLAAAGLELLVMDTRAHHALVDGQYGSRREMGAEAVGVLGVDAQRDGTPDGLHAALARLPHDELRARVRHVVTEIARVEQVVDLLRAGRTGDIGPLLDASHASLRDDYEVSCAELDVACATARSAGALGARMTGGGFGGSAIALCRVDDVEDVAAAVAQAFADQDFAAPAFLRAVPSPPASRVA